jgi:outer membrane receptor protein involved in Fe transport
VFEVVLGPATALYGANAHSGVINIISKAPSLSEGFSASFSGTADERNIKKFNARYSKKLNDKLSFKISGSHFSAVEWPFISESEYKSHRNPWVGFPGRQIDGKDNNPSITSHTGGLTPATESKLRWIVIDEDDTLHKPIRISPGDEYKGLNVWSEGDNVDGFHYLMLGDGEPNHGDLDGDGLAGEDWFNGHDDDGDGLVDEDYWWADGIDNSEPWSDDCTTGDTSIDGTPCSNEFDFIDCGYYDLNGDGDIDYICEGETLNLLATDDQGNYTGHYVIHLHNHHPRHMS